MPVGVVKWFNPQQNFCFIQSEGKAKDVFDFVHISAVERPSIAPVRAGQKVSYELEAEPDRPEPQGFYSKILK